MPRRSEAKAALSKVGIGQIVCEKTLLKSLTGTVFLVGSAAELFAG